MASSLQVDTIFKQTSAGLLLVNPAVQGYFGLTVLKAVSYAILDTDNYTRIECDTTAGDVTITLPLKSTNRGRIIQIANIAGGTNKVIINPNASDANKLSNDGLNVIWLPKIGDYITFQESVNSGFWEIINEKVSSQLRLHTHAGYGSTDTKIPRFTTVVDNYGNMFSENHSTGYSSNTKGLEFTIVRSGRWHFISGFFYFAQYHGITLNSTQLTTGIESVTQANILSFDYGNSDGSTTSWSGRLVKNDVVRIQSDGSAPGGGAIWVFTGTYLG